MAGSPDLPADPGPTERACPLCGGGTVDNSVSARFKHKVTERHTKAITSWRAGAAEAAAILEAAQAPPTDDTQSQLFLVPNYEEIPPTASGFKGGPAQRALAVLHHRAAHLINDSVPGCNTTAALRAAGLYELDTIMHKLYMEACEVAIRVGPVNLPQAHYPGDKIPEPSCLPYDISRAQTLAERVRFFGIPGHSPPKCKAKDRAAVRLKDNLERLLHVISVFNKKPDFEGYSDGAAGTVTINDVLMKAAAGAAIGFSTPISLDQLSNIITTLEDGKVPFVTLDSEGRVEATPSHTSADAELPDKIKVDCTTPLESEDILFVAEVPAGPLACSYSAENPGMSALINGFVARHKAGQINLQGKLVMLVFDTQSTLSAMAPGPLAATNTLAIMRWAELLDLAECGCDIAMVFAFSHCALYRNSMADSQADKALERIGVNLAPVWSVDGARFRHQPMILQDHAGLNGFSFREFMPDGPVKLSFGRPRYMDRALARLRTAVAPEFGILSHDRPPKCPFCDGPGLMARNGQGIIHLLQCPSLSDIREEIQQRHPQTPILWNPSMFWTMEAISIDFYLKLKTRQNELLDAAREE